MARAIGALFLGVSALVWVGRGVAADDAGKGGLQEVKPPAATAGPETEETPESTKRDAEPKEPSATKKRSAYGAKDPVASAFVLPRNVILSDRQADALATMRAEMEPRLREAIGKVQSVTASGEKLKAMREVKQLREQIRVGITQILQNQFPETAGDANKPQPPADPPASDEERKRQQAEAQKRLDQQRAQMEAERRRLEASWANLNAEQRKRALLDHKKWEEEQKKKQEAARKQAEEEQKKRAEIDRKKREEEQKKKADEDRKKRAAQEKKNKK